MPQIDAGDQCPCSTCNPPRPWRPRDAAETIPVCSLAIPNCPGCSTRVPAELCSDDVAYFDAHGGTS